MRFLTIRAKVTLWYTVFMIALVTIMLGLLVEISNTTIFTNYSQRLTRVMQEVVEDVEDEDEIDYFDDGVYILEYDEAGRYIGGLVPSEFSIDLTLRTGSVQEVKEGEYIFYIYDQRIETEQGRVLWVRGVIADSKDSQLNGVIVRSAFILMPILVLLSSVVGYFITKRAFKPVRQIQETAQKITDSKALSMRIGLPQGRDEICKLGQTIDGMLEQLERNFEKEKQFTSDASHELRTPIAVILNESEYGMQHLENLEEARESMEVINRQANRMTSLVNQLLFFARADKDSIKLNYEEVDIISLINEMIEERKMIDGKVHITLENNLQGMGRYVVDRTLFFRAVQNLIQNAIVYGKSDEQSEEDGIQVDVRIYEDGKYFVVEVQDYGIGIEPEDLRRIWDRFYQVDKARSRQNTGSIGLGLSMVKWIAQKHGGFVKVASTVNQGSTFSLYFLIERGENE